MEELYRSDLENLLSNAAYRAFREDLVERRSGHLKILSETLLTTPRKVAKANKMIGQIEEIDFMLVFPELVLAEIEDRELKLKREKEKEGKQDE